MNAATTPEEFALILEPMPFLSDEDKSALVETSKEFFKFLDYMMDKHKTTAEVIQARMDTAVNAKLSVKMIEASKSKDFTEEKQNEIMEQILCDVFDEFCIEEGFDGSLKEYAIKLMSIQVAMQDHFKMLLEAGDKDEIAKFNKVMEGTTKK